LLGFGLSFESPQRYGYITWKFGGGIEYWVSIF
jgi:hypothetical protein